MKSDKKFFAIWEKINLRKSVTILLICIAVLSFVLGMYFLWQKEQQKEEMQVQVEKLLEQKEAVSTAGVTPYLENTEAIDSSNGSMNLSMLPKYQSIYSENPDFIGWLSVENTQINYPVMQTLFDENYYLKRGFDKQKNENGCLILDTESLIGLGTKNNYETQPSTNLIIHGHKPKTVVNMGAGTSGDGGSNSTIMDTLLKFITMEKLGVSFDSPTKQVAEDKKVENLLIVQAEEVTEPEVAQEKK